MESLQSSIRLLGLLRLGREPHALLLHPVGALDAPVVRLVVAAETSLAITRELRSLGQRQRQLWGLPLWLLGVSLSLLWGLRLRLLGLSLWGLSRHRGRTTHCRHLRILRRHRRGIEVGRGLLSRGRPKILLWSHLGLLWSAA